MSLTQSQKTHCEMRIAHGLINLLLTPTLSNVGLYVIISNIPQSFEIELGPLDFNMVSEPPLGCWTDLPPIMVHVFG